MDAASQNETSPLSKMPESSDHVAVSASAPALVAARARPAVSTASSAAYLPLSRTDELEDGHRVKGQDTEGAHPAMPLNGAANDPVSWWRIYSLCIANFGINSAWALEFALTTPYFEKGLQAGAVISHAVWIVGPLSGLIVAPIVGAMSDRCTLRLGRRRPFILAGLIATVLAMVVFSNARELAALFFRPSTEGHRLTAIAIAIASFCVLDLAINTTMWPVRALQGDLVPAAQQHSVQSASIVMFSLGDLAVSGLINSLAQPVSNIRICFLGVGVVYALSIASLLFFGVETPLDPNDPSIQESQRYFQNIFAYLRGLPPWMWRIGATHALGFFALFCFLPNASSWLGSSVLGGDPNAEHGTKPSLLYEQGVTLYGKASLARSAIQIIYSAIYPWLLNFMTPGQLMGLSFGSFGIALLVLGSTHTATIGESLIVAMALPIAAHFTLPVGLTVQNSDVSNRGRFLGALNCFAVVPQLIDTGYTGFLSRALGEAAVMRVGAIWAILTGIVAVLFMRVN